MICTSHIKFLVLTIGIAVVTATNGMCQQTVGLAMYSQFSGTYNPASIPNEYVRNEHQLVVKSMVQRQWSGLQSGPRTQIIDVDYVAASDRTFNLLAGAYIINDRSGPISQTGVYGRVGTIMSKYNPRWGGFSAGIEAGIVQSRVDRDRLQEKYPNDILTLSNPSTISPSFGVGVSYYNHFTSGNFKGVHINTGISVKQVGFGETMFEDATNRFSLFLVPHTYLYGSIYKELKYGRAIEFNTWVKHAAGAPVNVDLHLSYYINEVINLEVGANSSGLGYFGMGLSFNGLGSNYSRLKISYSFNPSIMNTGAVLGNSHSLGLAYSL